MTDEPGIPIFIINLTRDVERWENIQRFMVQARLPYSRFSAIDGRRKLPLIRSVIRRDFVNRKNGRPLTTGEICCTLSHIGVLRRIIRRGIERAIILEDDAEFSEGFVDFYQNELPAYLDRCDVVKLEGLFYDHTSRSGPIICSGGLTKLIVPLNPTLGSAGYAVNLRGARALLKRLSMLDWPTDHLLIGYERYRAAFGEIRPMLIQQAAVASNIEVDRRQELNLLNADTSLRNGLCRRAGWLVRAMHRPLVMVRNVLLARFGRAFRQPAASRVS
ncbi:glycosyltransferase family 25 protein [Bradyrhizobium glycinis]|uniref:glycosyltransferase family 25 protein n=1 Tax=Bradyrhizobium glycinis TaxID=2751812 RepID=UPI0018DA2CBD|nr:glycosyltransferase family 25 protein [Bradyrhizobium glycinis]MBH5369000.1 glycosyltransferase family 25 protein [Bradyrhizobium glycinis]